MSLDKSQAVSAANQYVLQRNVQAAVEIYEKLIESDPTDLTAINTLGDLYASIGRVQDATARFSLVAAGYAERGLTRKAIATLKKIITVDPANIQTAIKLADLYAQAGLPSEARHHYGQIAEALTRKGMTLDALTVYNKVVDLDPSNTSGRIKLGELYLREGMNDQAYDAFVTAADQLAKGSENRRALNAYREALAIKPDNAEVKAAARKLSTLLGVVDPGKTAQNAPSQITKPIDRGIGSSAAPSLCPASGPSTSPGQDPEIADSFVIQQISKAEIQVAYGHVDQAIAMLRDVLREQPDSIDLHIKLKDIYLRNGMMAEAAHEYAELERIHDARGESERARDYAVRASRLTQLLEQPSGDLAESADKASEAASRPETAPQPEAAPRVQAVSRSETAPRVESVSRPPRVEAASRIEAAPARVASPRVPNPRPGVSVLETRVSEPDRITISVPPSAPLTIETPTKPAVHAPNSDLSSVNTGGPVSKPELVLVKSSGALALSGDANTHSLPVLFSSSTPSKRKLSRFAAAAVAGSVLVLLGAGTVIGRFAYEARLDKEYQSLAMAAPSVALPLPPSIPVFDEPAPTEESEPISVVVTPPVQKEAAAPPPSPQLATNRNAALPTSKPAGEPARVPTQQAPIPPRVAFTPDTRAAADNRTPVGVPVDVPIVATNAAEPPPKVVRQSPGVVIGGTVKRVDPVYPVQARQARLTGAVTVEVIINEQGNVSSARALSGPMSLRDAAVGAARAWKFKPSTLGGVPVPTTTNIIFNFKL